MYTSTTPIEFKCFCLFFNGPAQNLSRRHIISLLLTFVTSSTACENRDSPNLPNLSLFTGFRIWSTLGRLGFFADLRVLGVPEAVIRDS
ncbi:hypothetical protein AKJ16_DCAP25747 [Drosera capensis]